MKRKRITPVLFVLAIVAICTINIQRASNISKDVGYSGLVDMMAYNAAFASVLDESEGASCKGSDCDDANGQSYSTFGTGDSITCCGVTHTTRGKKKS